MRVFESFNHLVALKHHILRIDIVLRVDSLQFRLLSLGAVVVSTNVARSKHVALGHRLGMSRMGIQSFLLYWFYLEVVEWTLCVSLDQRWVTL